MVSPWPLKIREIAVQIKKIGILLLPFFLYFVPAEWLAKQHSVCLFYNLFGWECYGCGMARAVLSVIQLEFIRAYSYNKLVVVVFPALVYVWIVLWRQIMKR
ncbi:MAG: DUF2752 domain-containing protein [Prevotellaceae bacterium]|nr:DUF2752 domain-containing protein [Prevotellaceae bacterium]